MLGRLYGRRLIDLGHCPASSQHYRKRMSLRSLFGTLIAIAMLFAPLGLSSVGATVMVPVADHHAQMVESGDCDKQESKDSPSDSKSCCVAMCSPMAVELMIASEPNGLAPLPVLPSRAQIDPGFLAKLPTPPPRPA